MLSPKKLLENARNRIAKRENWVRGRIATTYKDSGDWFGDSVDAINPDAVAWCALGAISAEAGLKRYPDHGDFDYSTGRVTMHPSAVEAMDAVNAASRTLFGTSIVSVNDAEHGGHESVLAAFDQAIADMRSE